MNQYEQHNQDENEFLLDFQHLIERVWNNELLKACGCDMNKLAVERLIQSVNDEWRKSHG